MIYINNIYFKYIYIFYVKYLNNILKNNSNLYDSFYYLVLCLKSYLLLLLTPLVMIVTISLV